MTTVGFRIKAKQFVGMAAMALPVVLTALTAQATTATWIDTAPGTLGYWTNGANWNAGGSSYPGSNGVNENAYLTNGVAAKYTAVLDTPLTYALGTVEVKNTNAAGEAWLIVTNTLATSTNLFIRANGRLEIDSGGIVTNTFVTMDGTNGQFNMSGGSFFSITNNYAGHLMIGSGNGGKNNVLTLGDNSTIVMGGLSNTVYVGNNGVTPNANSNRLVVAGTNVLIRTGYAPSIGAGGSFNSMLVTGSLLWDCTTNTQFRVGQSGGASNTLVISGGTLTLTNHSSLTVGYGAGNNYNMLIVTNGGRLNTRSGVSAAYGASNNTVLVTGSGTWWDGGGGTEQSGGNGGASSNLFLIDQNATVTNATILVGSAVGMPSFNRLVITNGARWFSGSAATSPKIGQYGSNNTATVTGSNSVWDLAGLTLFIGYIASAPGASTNMNSAVVVDNGGTISGGGIQVGDVANAGYGYTLNNLLMITNGGQVVRQNVASYIGNATSNNLAVVTGTGSLWNCNGQKLTVGTGAAGTGNVLRIDNGGVITNCNTVMVGTAGGCGNSMIVTNGGQCWQWTSGDFTLGDSTASNTLDVSGGACMYGNGRNFFIGQKGATGNVVRVANGGSLLNWTGMIVGQNGSPNGNTLIITNGGFVSSSTARAGDYPSNSYNNVILVVDGGLLEANTFEVNTNNTTAVSYGGNTITNAGGIYQFSSSSPTMSLGTNSMVYLNGGTISFRGVIDATVFCNQSGGRLDSTNKMAFAGNNAFRLNNATNISGVNQTYTFDTSHGATNFYRLDMVNGATRYRGAAGNTLTIGATGQMYCSNTTAAVDLVFTNNGTLTLVNSTLSFANNATLNGTLAIDLDHLASTAGVLAAGNLTLTGNSALNLTGSHGTNATLVTYTGTLGGNGQFGSITGVPSGYSLAFGNGAISMRKRVGTAILAY